MKTTNPRFLNLALLGAVLFAPVTIAPVARAQEHQEQEHRKYQDKHHHDEHEWNDREDRAYRMWVQEKHHKYREFDKLKESDRESYWAWRHNHSDAMLKIDIR